jgi:hypothetical protein
MVEYYAIPEKAYEMRWAAKNGSKLLKFTLGNSVYAYLRL